MQKRGKKAQVTMFMILGIIILIAVALFLFLRSYAGVGISPQKFLTVKQDAIKQDILGCIDKETRDILVLIGKQGGSLTPRDYLYYNGNRLNYLCSYEPGQKTCTNSMLRLTDIQNELNSNLLLKLQNCFSTTEIAKAKFYGLETGILTIDTEIQKESVIVDLDYPITLTKGDTVITLNEFSKSVNVPLGALYEHVYNIVDYEARLGFFDQLPYMLGKKGVVEINVDKPYPDKIYILNMKNNPYIFQFAVKGVE